jgi:hypothetical protein
MSKIITISGKAEHGKTLAALILKQRLESLNKKTLIVNYSDLVKFYCSQYFGWDGKKDENGRSLLQYIGTDNVRMKNPDYWLQSVKNVVDLFSDEFDYFIIPDCRFPNEIDLWKKNNYNLTSIHVSRLNQDGLEYQNSLTLEQKLHISEIALDNYMFDYYIKSKSGIDNLTLEVDKLIEVIL